MTTRVASRIRRAARRGGTSTPRSCTDQDLFLAHCLLVPSRGERSGTRDFSSPAPSLDIGSFDESRDIARLCGVLSISARSAHRVLLSDIHTLSERNPRESASVLLNHTAPPPVPRFPFVRYSAATERMRIVDRSRTHAPRLYVCIHLCRSNASESRAPCRTEPQRTDTRPASERAVDVDQVSARQRSARRWVVARAGVAVPAFPTTQNDPCPGGAVGADQRRRASTSILNGHRRNDAERGCADAGSAADSHRVVHPRDDREPGPRRGPSPRCPLRPRAASRATAIPTKFARAALTRMRRLGGKADICLHSRHLI